MECPKCHRNYQGQSNECGVGRGELQGRCPLGWGEAPLRDRIAYGLMIAAMIGVVVLWLWYGWILLTSGFPANVSNSRLLF